jgi:hypothetical protein
MTLAERMFALRALPGFDQLRADELLAVAAGMTERRYRPGQVVAAADTSLWHLLVIVGGRVVPQEGGDALPPIVGADLLITNRSVPATLVADDREGAVCLRLSKGHFFTVVNECPALLVEMIRLHSPAAQGGPG